MAPLTVSEALSLLLATGETDLEISGGAFVRVHRVKLGHEFATVTAPRLSVATGMRLTGRVLGPDGRPWEVQLEIEAASYDSPDLALVRLAVRGVAVDTSRRAAARVPIGGVTWLVAVNCQDVVDGDRVEGTLEDLSKTGVSFATRRVLRVNDRLIFHGRFFADEINGEVRVASVRRASSPGQTIVGCKFIDLRPESEHKIERILTGGRESAAPGVDVPALREAATASSIEPEIQPGSWLRPFRRGGSQR